MKLQVYKTLWGVPSFQQGIEQALADGYDGIEGQVPAGDLAPWKEQLALDNLDFIAEICTTGQYVADRRQPLAKHLDDFQIGAQRAAMMGARFITCLGGCDAWPLHTSLSFFRTAMSMAEDVGLNVSFETHRGRTLFNPWVTVQVLDLLPDLKLTADFSHWCVVTERLLDYEDDELALVFERVHHIHGRVGYDQGPQVPHPDAPEYATALQQHEHWWQTIWRSQNRRQYSTSTLTPEFGPDGYLQCRPFTGEPVADLRTLNHWMAQRQRQQFAAHLL